MNNDPKRLTNRILLWLFLLGLLLLEFGELPDVELAVAVLVQRPESSGQPNVIMTNFRFRISHNSYHFQLWGFGIQ